MYDKLKLEKLAKTVSDNSQNLDASNKNESFKSLFVVKSNSVLIVK